jgi:hypothetical protein
MLSNRESLPGSKLSMPGTRLPKELLLADRSASRNTPVSPPVAAGKAGSGKEYQSPSFLVPALRAELPDVALGVPIVLS